MADLHIPLTADQIAEWRQRVTHARQKRKTYEPWWEANLKAYTPAPTEDPAKYGQEVNTNRDFTLVEAKKPQLFYQTPEISIKPSPVMETDPIVLKVHQDILNENLGPDGVDVKRLVNQILTDVLCPAGMGITKLGYESVTVEVPDPLTGQPMPVPIHSACFWSRVSPKQVLIPEDLAHTNFDDAAWLGVEFVVPLPVAKRLWTLPQSFTGGGGDRHLRDLHFDYGTEPTHSRDLVFGVELWYHAAVFEESVIHPQRYRKLVLLDGLEPEDAAVEHMDSPYQSVDPQTGRLTADSLIGNPIHILTIRDLPDSAYVPSDCTVSRPLVNELNKFREQMVRHRDVNLLRWLYDATRLPPDDLQKVLDSATGGFIGLSADAFAGGGVIRELPQGQYPRENFTSNDYIDNDLARTHALDATQAGVQTQDVKSATEMQLVQANTNVRLDHERAIVLQWYLRGVTKYSTLIQRFLSVEDAARIVGSEAAQQWVTWVKTVPSALAFTAWPDSAVRVDQVQERKKIFDFLNFAAASPYINQKELWAQAVRSLNLDPTKIVVDPPPTPKEPPKVSLALRGEDVSPLMPQYANVVQLLQQAGIQIQFSPPSPDRFAMPPMQTASAPKAPRLSQHQQDETGRMQGSGEPTPFGPGGSVQ